MQERIRRDIDAREGIFSTMFEYATYMLNKLSPGEDAKVPHERVRGKNPTIPVVEFKEKVFYNLKRTHKVEKLNARWEYGILVGAMN